MAASFIQRAEDVRAIRALIARHGGKMEILSKIENLEGVKNFDAILADSDGVMWPGATSASRFRRRMCR